MVPSVSSFLPLISSHDTWGNWLVLTGAASLAPWLGRNTRAGRLLGAPVSCMALVLTAASVGLLSSGGTIASQSLQKLSIQLATPLMLLGAADSLDRTIIVERCGPLLVSFGLAAVATIE